MATPTEEQGPPIYQSSHHIHQSSSDAEGTVVGDDHEQNLRESRSRETHTQESHIPEHTGRRASRAHNRLHLNVSNFDRQDDDSISRFSKSPNQSREQAHRLDDDLKLLQIERQVDGKIEEERAAEEAAAAGIPLEKTQSTSVRRERSAREDLQDDFDVATNPLHERAQIYTPPENPASGVSKFFKRVHNSSFIIRYITYITPVVLILLVPLLVGGLVPGINGADGAHVGGVGLLWFMVWLEIVWLTLWLGRIIAKLLPYPIGLIVSLFTNNSKKWRDMVKELELAATLFFWLLAVEISFLPTMVHHQQVPPGDGNTATTVRSWQKTMNKVLVSFLVLAGLNFIEKIIIQLIAISFHQRTYEDRIVLNRFHVGSLTKLYAYSKLKLREVQDSDFEMPSGGERPASGAITPGQVLEKAQKNTQKAVRQFGDVAGKIAGDFTGRQITKSSHPSQVVLLLLGTTGGAQVLARRLYRTFNREETETIHQEDLILAFENEEECDAAFTMFDKDMNGDISMDELEAVCVEIGRERKAITASLKDLDSVVSKLDNCFMFIVVIIAILVLISLISTAAAGFVSNAGSVVLALSWLFSATAQEFLQSVIFVFVKHPFDVGDRVTIYGNTGENMKGDDYFVKEIALLYTEFKKMEGHVVQAPNSYLNTLFILNQRRSGGLAEAVPIIIKFGTSIDQIQMLRDKLLEFVKREKREYQSNVLTELRSIDEAHSLSLNIVFFFKSNWQNELLRLQRRNKFICAMMIAIQESGIEGPRMRYPGQRESFPLYMQHLPFDPAMRGRGGNPDFPNGRDPEPIEPRPDPRSPDNAFPSYDGASPSPHNASQSRPRGPSVSAMPPQRRERNQSIVQQGRKYDLSLGMSEISSGDMTGDVFDDVPHPRLPIRLQSPSRPGHGRNSQDRQSHDMARTTSRAGTFGPGMLNRSSTEGPRAGSVHRNRFFSRASVRPSHDVERMEAGMAGIPEAGSPPNERSYMNPRTGTIGPQAMRLDSNASMRPEMTDNGRPLFEGPLAPRASVDQSRSSVRRSVDFKMQ